jgi:hypothetical protein
MDKLEENIQMVLTEQLTGRWKNSKSTTIGISTFHLENVDNQLSLTINGADGGFLPYHMGPITVSTHSATKTSKTCIAFHANVSKDGNEYSFAGNVNKGLIIIATYVKVKADDTANFFVREFFYKLK